jgi:peptidoglycan/LPS O-acetylase OafA/YrhL
MDNSIMPEAPFSPTAHQQRMLTGVRGVAALWVVFAHLVYRAPYGVGFGNYEHFGWLAFIIRFDFLAVDFFFVLSGCLLYLAYRPLFEQKKAGSSTIDRFYLQRLARIYPMHLLGLACIGIYQILGIPHPAQSGMEAQLFTHWKASLIVNAVLMHAWGIMPSASWNEPAWTVSVMAFVYILFPNFVHFLRFLPDTARANGIAITALILGYALARSTIPDLSQTDGTGALLRSFSFFLTGCFSARLYALRAGSAWRWGWVLAALMGIGCGAMILWFLAYRFPVTLFHFSYPFFMLCLLYARGGASWALSNPLSVFLGRISYSLYMLHYPVLLFLTFLLEKHAARLVDGEPLTLLALYPGTLGILVLIAWAATRYVELPLLRFFKRRIRMESP